MLEQFLWVEKYRPKTVAETILPADLKVTFQQFIDQKNIPNLILAGSAGVGKTTVAKAMLEELECDYIIINGSMNGGIDTLRNEIQNFASTVSFTGGRKYVILDEADYLSNATQPALRNFMEEFSKNCGFILTCNFKNRIIEPLHSRCSVIEFKITKKDIAKLASEFLKRVQNILEQESIDYERAAVAGVITKHFPDWRRVLNELQRYAATGKIDSGILVDLDDSAFRMLIDHVKGKNFTEMRKWVGQNISSDTSTMFRKFYDDASNIVKKESIPKLVMIIAQYQYQAAFVADHEINFASFLAEVAIEIEFL